MTERLVTFPTWHQDTLRTTDGLPHTIATITMPPGNTVGLHIIVIARCTDLYVDEGLFAEGKGGWTDVGGVATPMGNDMTVYSNAYSWSVDFDQTGLDILVNVTGELATNVSWVIRWFTDQVEEV